MDQLLPLIACAIVLAGISAAIVVGASSKRLIPYMLVWALAPMILMACVLGLGSLLTPARESTGANAIFALMLIGTIVALPWAAVCAVGFGIGYAIRRRRTPSVIAQPPPIAPAAAPVPPIVAPPGSAAAPPQRYLPPDAPPPHFSQSSPDGSLRIDIMPVEWAREQWVHTPRVVEAATGRILCDLLESDWQADTAFPRDRYIWLGLRRYRTPGYLFAAFDLEADRYRIALTSLDEPEEEGPLGDVSERLEVWWRTATARAEPFAMPPPTIARPGPFAAWRSALVILVGAIVAIAGLSWYSVTYKVDPPHVPIIIRPGAAVPR